MHKWSTPTSTNAVSTSVSAIAYRHQSAATTEFLKAVCSVPCCSLSTPRQLSASSHPSETFTMPNDTQLYIALSTDKALSVINDCFQSAHRWLDANGLCLNPDKTEAVVIGTTAKQRLEPSTYCHDGHKTRSHHIGGSPSSLASCYCPHSVPNCAQDTHYPSSELHSLQPCCSSR